MYPHLPVLAAQTFLPQQWRRAEELSGINFTPAHNADAQLHGRRREGHSITEEPIRRAGEQCLRQRSEGCRPRREGLACSSQLIVALELCLDGDSQVLEALDKMVWLSRRSLHHARQLGPILRFARRAVSSDFPVRMAAAEPTTKNASRPVPDWSASQALREARHAARSTAGLMHERLNEQVGFRKRQHELLNFQTELRNRQAFEPCRRVDDMRRAEAEVHEQQQQQLRQLWVVSAQKRRDAENNAVLLQRTCDERQRIERVDCGPWTKAFEIETSSELSCGSLNAGVVTFPPEISAFADRAVIGFTPAANFATSGGRSFAARLDHFGRLRRGRPHHTSSCATPPSWNFGLQPSHSNRTRSFNAPPTLRVDEATAAAHAQRQRWGAHERPGPTFCCPGSTLDGGNCTRADTASPGTSPNNIMPYTEDGKCTDVATTIAGDHARLRATATELKLWSYRGNGPLY